MNNFAMKLLGMSIFKTDKVDNMFDNLVESFIVEEEEVKENKNEVASVSKYN